MRKKILFFIFLLFFPGFLPVSRGNSEPSLYFKIYKYTLKSLPPSLRELFPGKIDKKIINSNYKGKDEIINRIKYLTLKQIKQLKGFPDMKGVINRYVEIIFLIQKLNDFKYYLKGNNISYARDFNRYIKMEYRKFVPVFYGYHKFLFENGNIDRFLSDICERNKKIYSRLLLEYKSGKNCHSFDDRSAGFGIASIIFSRTITDAVNIILYSWWISNGDVSSAPYFPYKKYSIFIMGKKKKKEKKP